MKVSDAKKYKDSLYTALSRDLSDFEKNFLLIAAGVLTFSITFIKDIVNISDAKWLPLLFGGWIGFGVAEGLMMLTLIQSAHASDRISFAIEDFLRSNNKWEDTDDLDGVLSIQLKTITEEIFRKQKRRLKRMRYAAIGIFLLGFIFFGWFVGGNLLRENTSKKNPPTLVKLNRSSGTVIIDNLKINWKDSTLSIENSMK